MKKLFDYIDSLKDFVIELQSGLTEIPAVNPENGGDGEYNKFLYLKDKLKSLNFSGLSEIMVPDDRVSSKIRPSLLVNIEGENNNRTLWIITHLDVVPAGDEKLWENPPFKAVVKGDVIYGRGVEDNQQSLISSIIAGKALIDNNIKPFYNIKLLFVADEEVGSVYGIQWILENKNLFKKDDLILSPDGGNEDSTMIEVAEKSILWATFSIVGRQSHGSRPDLGINTSRASSHFCVQMENLNKIFNKKDEMYDLPYSTFEPTKRSNSIENMNTIPGKEILGYDCRVLPDYNLDDVINEMKKIAKNIEKEFNVKIEMEINLKLQAPEPTPTDSDIVKLLQKSVKKILNKEAKPVGIGGGTVAAYFRMKGYQAALWSTIDVRMHSPNEYSKISNTLNDAKVFLDLMNGSK